MRSNGLPNFPDPQQFAGGNLKLTISQPAFKNNPKFEAAWNACKRAAPQNGGPQQTPQQIQTKIADGVSFARCMRNHAVAHPGSDSSKAS